MRILLLVCLLLLQACATSSELVIARNQFRDGSAQLALKTLDEADVSNRDELLLLLDKALIAQAAQNYALSVATFEEAYNLVDSLDYVSTRDQTAALVSSDWAIRYSGELSERLWIHTFQMINYLLLEQPQEAAVEARRAVVLFEEDGDVLDSDIFTRYLMALSFAAAGQYDSAGVEFRKLELDPALQTLRPPSNGNKELVLLVATGFIEPKQPGDIIIDIDKRVSFPFYPDFYERAPDVRISAGTLATPVAQVDTELITIARSALAKRAKTIAARQALRLAAKYNLANNIEDQDELAGAVAKIFLFAIERADTRSWETLPAYLTLVRAEVPADTTSVDIQVTKDDAYHQSRQRHSLVLDLDDSARQFHLIRLGARGDLGLENSLQQWASP